ncbi:hypothetical protein GQ53DRAFT_748345 [Thozetella sp. PMI_491]|nr:hypothetical protein GQ53DRAFT_748345 [Thozetella sp. PMI_491]
MTSASASTSSSPTLVDQEDGTSPADESHENSDSDEEDLEVDQQSWMEDEDESMEITEEQHDNHIDTTVFKNPWLHEWESDWHGGWIRKDDRSLPNDHFYENEVTQRWMQALSGVRRNAISLLLEPRGATDSCQIPLFKDGNGWEYHISLDIGRFKLPRIECPAISGDPFLAASLFELRARARGSENQPTDQTPAIPRFAVQLGILKVRSDARYPKHFSTPTTVTEATDYKVFVDVDSDDMPLWLLAPRSQLQARLNNPWWGPYHAIRQLPMFNGLLENDDCGYDCACILPSIRRLGSRPPNPDAPSFDEACQLIRATRAIIDPAGLLLTMDRVKDFNGGVPMQACRRVLPFSDLGLDSLA